ncbi:hypothetical protein GCM10027168_30450 [Streptomyces capparidis]
MTFVDETTRGGRSDAWELDIAEERPTEVFRALAQPDTGEVSSLKLLSSVGG